MHSVVLLILVIAFTVKHVAHCGEMDDLFQLLDYNRLFPDKMAEQFDSVLYPEESLPEAEMNAFEIIRYYEYPAEQYDVTTEDGYILTIQRIPYGKSGPGDKPRQPVIIQHGFLCSSIVWLLNTPPKSLGFILADAGYDVWLSNIRGNTYGRKHVRLSPKSKEFWEFSFDEMGRYDMPAIIDFILSKTGYTQTNYIGHSMGTTLAFVMLSSRPEYNNKVRSFMALAPAISMRYSTSSLVLLKPFIKDIKFIMSLMGEYEVLPNNRLNKFFGDLICKYSPTKVLCSTLLFMFDGAESDQLNITRLPVYTSHMPAGASVQTVMHCTQLIDPGFKRFDYGPSINIRKYGQPTPPSYDMNNVTTPVGIYWSENDVLADPTDVSLLEPQVPNVAIMFKVPFAKFTHMDFCWANDGKSLIYDKVIQVMRKLWPSE